MPLFMLQGAYTSESWATQVRNQQNPVDRLRPLAEACAGRLEAVYYAFGDADIIVILEAPDDEAAAAFSLATTARGSLRFVRTTKLLTVEQGLSAMGRAADAGKAYTPPVDSVTSTG